MIKRIGKRGSYDISRKTLYFIIVLFVLAFIFIYTAGTISKHYTISSKNKDAVMGQILLQETIYSPYCLAYYDETTGRTYPGIIDESKYNGEKNKLCRRYLGDIPYAISMTGSDKVIAGGMLGENTDKAERGVLLKKATSDKLVYVKFEAEMNDYYLGNRQSKPSDNRETLERMSEETGENLEKTINL
ncbi:MAG: hypothetical protein PHO02_02100 [Candidatus Nanoarchaeia archaeon]|nr:hypothetical protein [Candidatus Nanoarchaeia archaeon]